MKRVSLRDLLPESTELELLDGTVVHLPPLGVDEMGELVLLEEGLDKIGESDDPQDGLAAMRELNGKLNEFLKKHNPDMPYQDFPAGLLPHVIAEIASAGTGTDVDMGSVSEVVRLGLVGEDATTGEVIEAAQKLSEEAGTADEDSVPLASPKRSRTQSSRSASSGNGTRRGGSKAKSRGRSSSRTSAKRAASTPA